MMFQFTSPGRDRPEDKQKFCNAPRTSIDFNPKESSDSEHDKSPTSPLDIETFSGFVLSHWHENILDSRVSSPKQQSEGTPIGSPHRFSKLTHQTGLEHSESYTCVISHGSKSSEKIMYTPCGIEREIVQYHVQTQNEPRDIPTPARRNSNVAVFPVTHFLRACYLCKRELNHGKDIYMYRGDKAFCSVECRYQQILMDDGVVLMDDGVVLATDFGG